MPKTGSEHSPEPSRLRDALGQFSGGLEPRVGIQQCDTMQA
jgi:hypothetical protein